MDRDPILCSVPQYKSPKYTAECNKALYQSIN